MKLPFAVFGILCGLLLGTTQLRADEVRVGAGAAATENILKKIQQPMAQEIGLTMTILDNGPVEAFLLLDKNDADIIFGGVAFPEWLAMMEKAGHKVEHPENYKNRVIGKDLIHVITSKDLGVTTLSKDQLKGIFTGKTTNWKDVGGPDQNIELVLGTKIPGTQAVFQKQIMDGEAYASQATQVATAKDIHDSIGKAKAAIGLAPSSLLDDTVTKLQTPEVGRPITAVTKGAPPAVAVKLLTYINGDGQKYWKK